MSDTVSVMTGRALAAAGWKWEPKEGDWCWDETMKVKRLISPNGWSFTNGSREQIQVVFIWLPRLGDLLRELAKRVAHGVDMDFCHGRWFVCYWTGEFGVGPSEYYEHEQPEEAAAQALLAVLEGEGKGKE